MHNSLSTAMTSSVIKLSRLVNVHLHKCPWVSRPFDSYYFSTTNNSKVRKFIREYKTSERSHLSLNDGNFMATEFIPNYNNLYVCMYI